MDLYQKSQTVDPEVRAHIHSLVSAIGGQSTSDTPRYSLGDDALAVLNDLVRWLRLYDEKTNRLDVRRCLAESNVVAGDLLPILALWSEEEQEGKLKAKLALKCLELLVPLTWPVLMAEEKTTVNHLRHLPYLQLAQCGYKRAVLGFEDARVLRTIVRVALPHMALPRRQRGRRDENIIRMVLYFFRNIALISQPQDLPSQGDENEISRSATIVTFHEEDVLSFLLTLGSGAMDEFAERDVEILEILFHLLRGVDPKKLFSSQRQLEESETNELQSLMAKEKAMLNQYTKHAPTRHNRFGTMIWVKRGEEKMTTMSGQNSITNSEQTLKQMDASKRIDKRRQTEKYTAEDLNESELFGAKVEITDQARRCLRAFVDDFLDSSFNPFFGSLRKGIAGGAERIGPNHPRQFYYLISWFLSAESARRSHQNQTQNQNQSATQPLQQQSDPENTFAHIAAVLDQETFILLTRQMQKAHDDKIYNDLQAILLTFTQTLHTVQSMSESFDEEDQEIAENIQNRIFYEESTHELLVTILRTYRTTQSFSYLDAVTECVHVFVRMLERYSKQTPDLQIRSKRKASRKKRAETARAAGSTINEEDEEDVAAADAEDEIEAHTQVRERKFDFDRFSAKFLQQGCVDTFLALLRFYRDLTTEQLKRCHRYLYRLVFKQERGIFLFRVDVLALLHKIIKGPEGLNKDNPMFKEMETLVQQIFRRCIKWIERPDVEGGEGWREAAVVEMLFSKIPSTVFFLQNGYDKVVEKRAPRPPAELEVKRSVDEGKRVGVAVTILLELGRGESVEWVRKQVGLAAEERGAWEGARDARVEAAAAGEESGEGAPVEDKDATPAPTIFLSPDSSERKESLFKDKYLRLLLTTLGLQRLGIAEDTEASWIIPSELSAQQLQKAVEQIQAAEFSPPEFEEGQSAQELVRSKPAGRRGATFSGSDSESEREIDGAMFPPNARAARAVGDGEERPKKKRRLQRRNQGELTEEQAAERAKERARRERERNARIKSELIVEESDDEEADAEFFRLEEERRNKMAGVIRNQLLKEAREGAGEKKKGRRGKGKKKRAAEDSEGEDGEDEDEDEESRPKKRKITGLSSDDEMEQGDADADADADEGATSDTSAVEVPSSSSAPSSQPKQRQRQIFGEFYDSEDEDEVGDEKKVEVGDGVVEERVKVPLKEVDANAGIGRMFQEESEDEEPVVKPAMQRRRLVVGGDSDDE